MSSTDLSDPTRLATSPSRRSVVSAVLVHYHAEAELRRAIEALRATVTSAELEVIVVDNGRSEDLAVGDSVRVLDPRRNLGYAGGVNLGVEEATGDALVIMNPDVTVWPGCVDALLAALEQVEIVGPRFHWNEAGGLLLPPADPRTRLEELLRALAGRGSAWADLARRRWRRHARQHWEADRLLRSHHLSGALLAFRRTTWRKMGHFDEGYRLYFEESDWLERARRLRVRCAYEPKAQAHHQYQVSSRKSVEAGQWFSDSMARFRRRHYGERFARLLERLESRARHDGKPRQRPVPRGDGWLEVSPLQAGIPAAGVRCSEPLEWRLPEDVDADYDGDLWARFSDVHGRGSRPWCLARRPR